MSNLDLTYIEDLVITQDTGGVTQTTVMYIDYEESKDTSYEDRRDLRDLKVGELIDGEDNSKEIKELETSLEIRGTWESNNPQMTTISPRIKTLNVKLTESIKISKEEHLTEMVKDIREDILDEIYKISSVNYVSTSQVLPDLNFSSDDSIDVNIVSRKIISRMLACSKYVAMEGRIGPANTVIMHPKIAHLIYNNISTFTTPVGNSNVHKVGTFSGMEILTDYRLGNNVVVFRKSNDMTQINDNLVFFYDYRNGKMDYKIQQIEDCDTNYIEFHINGLDI